jgi:hypothetical protein
MLRSKIYGRIAAGGVTPTRKAGHASVVFNLLQERDQDAIQY